MPLILLVVISRYMYDFEYLGPKQPLIITPITDRAQFSLLQAVKDYRLGTLIGPTCTGKTDTIISLARVNYCKKHDGIRTFCLVY